MRKASQLIAVALVALLIASCVSRGAKAPESWATDEAEIRSLIQISMEAWNRGDITGHLAYYDPNVTFMTKKNGPRPGVAAIEESFKKNYFQDGHAIQSLRFENISVRPLARDVALVTGHYVLSGGGKPEEEAWFTLVWVRGSEEWHAVHDHTYS